MFLRVCLAMASAPELLPDDPGVEVFSRRKALNTWLSISVCHLPMR